jgi:hypothetical protein
LKIDRSKIVRLPIRPGPPRLQRVAFKTSRLAEFCGEKELRLADKRRKRPLPAGKVCGQLIASPAKIRAYFQTLADGADAGGAGDDDPAAEMTTDGVVELSHRGRRPDRRRWRNRR